MTLEQPIGVFDSGVGGLSVLYELRRQMPNENYLYIGDSGRNPYGPRSVATVTQFTLEAAGFLQKAGAKAMVIACNTATVAALDATIRAFPDMFVIGVVEAGCLAAIDVSSNGHIAVVASKGTIDSGGHAAKITELRPGTNVTGVPAPLFVALAEEGWLEGAAPEAVAERYLGELFAESNKGRPDSLILGCTHFPLLEKPIRKAVGDKIILVDPAAITAQKTQAALAGRNQLRKEATPGAIRFCVTADAERFARIGSLFLQTPIAAEDVQVVSLA